MAAEIAEQPAALQATSDAVRRQHAQMRAVAEGTDQILLFARGSSDTAATYGRYLFEIVSRRPAALGAPSVATLYGAHLDLSTTLTVVCSQSGDTAELLQVADWARGCGSRVVGVTNEASSRLAAEADLTLVTQAGRESAVPATKSHTTCLMALAELSVALTDNQQRRTLMLQALDRVPSEAERLIHASDQLQPLIDELLPADTVCVTGRGFTYATALELGLKLEETTGKPCVSLSQADLEHGPMALLEDHRPLVVASAATGPTLSGLRAVMSGAQSRGAPVLVLGGDEQMRAQADHAVPGPDVAEEVTPIALVIPGQLLVERVAQSLGRDPDRPVGLSKVTQTS